MIIVATDWWIDPSSGSDSNPGTRNLPLRTFRKLLEILTDAATVFVNPPQPSLAIHWLSDQPDNSDPVSLAEWLHNVPFTMDGEPIQVGSGTFGAVTNIVRPSGITTTAVNSDGSEPANYWAQLVGCLLHDVTQDSWMRVDVDLGSRTAQLTAPFKGAASAFNIAQGAIAAGDAFVVYRFPRVYVGQVAMSVTGEVLYDPTLPASMATFEHLHFAATGAPLPGVLGEVLGVQFKSSSLNYAAFLECTFEGIAGLVGQIFEQTILYNCSFLNGGVLRNVIVVGGHVFQPLTLEHGSVLDGDAMVHGDVEINGDVQVNLAYFDYSKLDVPLWALGAPVHGTVACSLYNSYFGVAALWGSAQLKIHPNGAFFYDTAASACLLLVGGIEIDGLATGAKIVPGSPRTIVDGVAITPANIDDVSSGRAAGMISSQCSPSGIFPFA